MDDGGGGEADPHPLLRQPKRTAVLVFMLLEAHGETVSRERLVEVFWPAAEGSRGRASLRQTLRYLRSCLPDGAVVRRGNVEVGVDPALVECDVARFRALLDEGRAAAALELVRGDLLEGFLVDAGDGFDTWLGERRDELRSVAASEAWRLASDAEEDGRGEEAAFWGKRALSLSTFDEAGVQRLMALLARVGDPLGAERAFRGLAERLRREEREPEALTRRILEKARAVDPDDPSTRLESGGGRRSGVDRRSETERRTPGGSRAGGERRSGSDRRGGDERRSGRDRRRAG